MHSIYPVEQLCLPMDLEEDIPDNHFVRVVNTAVNRLDDDIFDVPYPALLGVNGGPVSGPSKGRRQQCVGITLRRVELGLGQKDTLREVGTSEISIS